jgi:hypothetical protein
MATRKIARNDGAKKKKPVVAVSFFTTLLLYKALENESIFLAVDEMNVQASINRKLF